MFPDGILRIYFFQLFIFFPKKSLHRLYRYSISDAFYFVNTHLYQVLIFLSQETYTGFPNLSRLRNIQRKSLHGFPLNITLIDSNESKQYMNPHTVKFKLTNPSNTYIPNRVHLYITRLSQHNYGMYHMSVLFL